MTDRSQPPITAVLVLLLSLVLAGCSLVPGSGKRDPSAGGLSPKLLATVGPGWMVVLLNSTQGSRTELALVSPEGTQHHLSDLPAGTELLDATLRVDQILLAQPVPDRPVTKKLSVFSPRANTTTALPGEYVAAQFFQAGAAKLLVRRVDAPAWELADLAGATVTQLPTLTSDAVVANDLRQQILGSDITTREFVLVDATPFGDNDPRVQQGGWDDGVRDCTPLTVGRGWGQFVCTDRKVDDAILANFEPGQETGYSSLGLDGQTGQVLSAHQLQTRWLLSQRTTCGGSVFYDEQGNQLPGSTAPQHRSWCRTWGCTC